MTASLHPQADATGGLTSYRIACNAGGWLWRDETGRLVAAASDLGGRLQLVVGVVPDRAPDLLILACANALLPISPRPTIAHAPLAAMRLAPHPLDRWRALRNLWNEGYASVAPAGDGSSDLRVDRARPDSWEAFRLEPTGVGNAAMPPGLDATLSRLPLTWADPAALADWIANAPDAAQRMCGALVLMLAGERCTEAALALLSDPERVLAFAAAAFRDDPWGALAGSLERWRRGTPVPYESHRMRDADLAARLGDSAGHIPLARIMLGRARALSARGAPGSLGAVTLARNNGRDIVEWVAHHRAIGCAALTVYSTPSHDGSDLVLQALARHGIVTWIGLPHIDGVSPYEAFTTDHFSRRPEALTCRWSVVLDIDEFLILDRTRHATIGDWLAARDAEDVGAIGLSRRLYFTQAEAAWRAEPKLARFTGRYIDALRQVKHVARTAHVAGWKPFGPHLAPGVPVRFHDAAGHLYWEEGAWGSGAEKEPDFSLCWLAGYRHKSVEEFVWEENPDDEFRADAGAAAVRPEPRHVASFIRDRARGGLITDLSARAHLAALEVELAAIRRLPGVAEAEADMLEITRSRSIRLRAALARRMRDDPTLRGIALEWLGAESVAASVS